MKRSLLPYLALIFLAAPGLSARAGEIHSNGLGGGKWSEAGSWEEKRVPVAEDTVVIASGDTVIFDRDDSAVISCAALSLDPEAQFEFQTAAGKKVLRVNGSIEAYGHLRMDGSQAPTDQLEIELLGDQPPKLSLFKGGGLVISGAADLPEGRKNILIKSTVIDVGGSPVPGAIEAGTGAALDVKNATLDTITVTCTGINNTGLKPNERLNFTYNNMVGGYLILTRCDTPRISNNTFKATKSQYSAITVAQSPMAEIKANQISGYTAGIAHQSEDIMITDNVVDTCDTGISYYGNFNGMIRGGKISNCKIGLAMTYVGGVVEDIKIENCAVGINVLLRSNFQASNITFTFPAEGEKVALSITNSNVTLLNCNVTPEQVKFTGPPNPPVVAGDPILPALITMQYVVVKVTGTLPANAQVRLLTAGGKALPKGATDPNVRNSPAMLRPDGLSPLPDSQGAMLATSWGLGPDGAAQPAPSYKLSVITPSASGDGTEVKSITIKPDAQWYRPDLKSEKPTVELPL